MKTAVIHLLEEADVRDLIGGKPFAIEGAGGSRVVIATEKSFDPARLFNGGGQLERKQLAAPKRKTRRGKSAARRPASTRVSDRLLKCGDCAKTFRSQAWLDNHRKKKHTTAGGGKFQCFECGDKFPTIESRLDHMKRKHPDALSD